MPGLTILASTLASRTQTSLVLACGVVKAVFVQAAVLKNRLWQAAMQPTGAEIKKPVAALQRAAGRWMLAELF